MVGTVNESPNATSTRMRPGNVLNRGRDCITQIVGTTAGGMIRPASTKVLINTLMALFRRSST